MEDLYQQIVYYGGLTLSVASLGAIIYVGAKDIGVKFRNTVENSIDLAMESIENLAMASMGTYKIGKLRDGRATKEDIVKAKEGFARDWESVSRLTERC